MARSRGTRYSGEYQEESLIDTGLLPPSLISIAPILRVANEIEPLNPRVAYLCRFTAFEKAHNLDPESARRGARQFKTNLMHRLEKEEDTTRPILARNDPGEILKFYRIFYEENIKEGPTKRKHEEMVKNYQIASVLYDVLRNVVPAERIDDEILRYAKEVERKSVHYAPFNILPLQESGAAFPVMELPEIKAAVNALRKVDNLPKPTVQPTSNTSRNSDIYFTSDDGDHSIHDLLDWLWAAFGFQKGNVANQREHLILLLANVEIRNRNNETFSKIHNDTMMYLMDKIFKNYRFWCDYLHCKSNLKFPRNAGRQQLELLYIGLYLLIWGESSNIRFMPECICYIFHNMANELHAILFSNAHLANRGYFQSGLQGEESFLQAVITPIYELLRMETQRSKGGTASHSNWRNYDDLNEYFWSNKCFNLGWPMKRDADFFVHSLQHPKYEHRDQVISGERKPKTNFVEVRTFWHLFRSFDRMWIFFILSFQAMVIIAWSPSGSITAFFDPDVFRSISSIFITGAFLNFLQATLDIILSWKAWGNMEYSQKVRYILKFVVATVWSIVLPIGYSRSVHYSTGHVKFLSNRAGNWQEQSFYNVAVAIYLLPNVLAGLLFMVPSLRRSLEHLNWHIIILLLWWAQPKLYVGSGMHEDMLSLLKYSLFWALLLISKLAFSYYVEILPLIEPTKLIMGLRIGIHEWHELFPNVKKNIFVVVSIWTPIVLVYLMDAQIWYAIFSTLVGGINGVFCHLGEIQTLRMLRSRFEYVPRAFRERLVPSSLRSSKVVREEKDIENFSHVWNEFINSLRVEDLISNNERDLLLVPYSSIYVSVVRWPLFLLASKIHTALDVAKNFQGRKDADLFGMIKNDESMYSAVIECYETLTYVVYLLLDDERDKTIIRKICHEVDTSIEESKFLSKFRMTELPLLKDKLSRLLTLLESGDIGTQVINVLQDIIEIITQDVMIDKGNLDEYSFDSESRKPIFQTLNLNIRHDRSWMEKVIRLHLLLTVEESATNFSINVEACRRITFFTNSLFMNMPRAPKVRNMLSFSVLTPYYREDVLYSEDELNKENEDGISMLFYLQKIYPDEWNNFLERMGFQKDEYFMDLVRQWVSYRRPTLYRTVRGMMYYKQALLLQEYLDILDDQDTLQGYRRIPPDNYDQLQEFSASSQAVADMKFTYVVSCLFYGAQKKSSEPRDRSCYQNILSLMLKYPSLRVAYIDEREEVVNGKSETTYYSVLVKGGDKFDEEIYRIRLPGPPTVIGETKPENQNHAIIFTRGEALQTIDMNQDNYLEEAFKMRNVLEEFLNSSYMQQKPTILGLREHIYTESISSLAWFMSNQENSFVTIGQRILANLLKVRFHYGHSDVFDRIFHLTRGGISKASKTINLSEGIFSGFNSTLRGGNITHHEYIQVGKECDVGMNQSLLFEAKAANGNGEQTLSRDVYRLGRQFDFYRMLSFYFSTVGFYFSSMVTVLTVFVFLYGRLYLVMSGLEVAIVEDPSIHQSKSFETALAAQSIFQFGLLLVLPTVMEIGIERGFRTALADFVIMQLQLASVFFAFQLGTKCHYYGRTILHGGTKYRPTRREFVVFHAKFADNYRSYSRSHFVKGLELMILLVMYKVYGHSYHSSTVYLFVTFSMWFLVASWLLAPFLFNPLGFDWQKTVDDWTDWKRWMNYRGGIGIQQDRSWESWWDGEQDHLKHTDTRGRVLEIILALRFLVYQYGIVYHLNIAHHSKNVLVYGLSWLVLVTILFSLKMVSMDRRKFSTDIQLMIRIIKKLIFLGFISIMAVLFVVYGLTISDVFASILGFMPTGWAVVLIGQACRPLVRAVGLWDSTKELARAYEFVIGIIIFMPIFMLSWFSFVSEFQTRLLFFQAFGRGLQISQILTGWKDTPSESESRKSKPY